MVKALADIGGAPAGLLLLADEHLPAGARRPLELDRRRLPPATAPRRCSAMSRQGGFVIDFDAVRDGWLVEGETRLAGAALARRRSKTPGPAFR